MDSWYTPPSQQTQFSGASNSWYTPPSQQSQQNTDSNSWYTPPSQQQILSTPTQITQSFGTYNPIEPTPNHIAGDTNFAANAGDPVAAPPGKWTVIKAYNQANPQGSPGDYTDNEGWGNDVWLQDSQGNILHFLHLAGVNAQPGQVVQGGSVVGQVGDSGNSTGANLGVEYYDSQGQLSDFMQSPYAQYMPLQQNP